MARTSKFSFPLPGRSLITTKGSNGDDPILYPIEDISQMSNGNQSKAERLLGATDFGPLYRKPEARPKKAPREKHSLVNIPVSDSSQDHASKGDERIDPATTTDDWKPPRLSPRGLFPRPSSPLLGRHFHDGSIRTEKGAVSANNDGLHESPSSSTIRSYYDPANSPLSVSQQTSASSARDMALRKGCKPVCNSQHRSACQDRMDMTATDSSEQVQACESSRKRPPRLDFSRLFPRSHTFGGSLLSPHRVTKSPSALSIASDILPATPTYAKQIPSRSSTSRDSLSTSNERQASYSAPTVESTIGPDVTVKKPRRGLKYWFGATEKDVHLDRPTWESRPSREAFGHLQCVPTVETASCSSWHTLPKPRPETQSNAQSFQPRDPVICLSSLSRADNVHCPSSPRSRISRRSTGSIFTNSDLQNESVLALSSSEDEDESDGQGPMYDSKHCHRNIAASTTRHDNVNRGGTHSIPTLRPVKIHAHSDSKLSSGSRSSTVSVRNDLIGGRNGRLKATFLHPPSVYSPSYKRLPENRASEFISEDPRPKSSNAVTATSPIPLGGFVPTPASRSRSESRIPPRQSRIMAVTREEESLLEAMRKKKAAMRQNIAVPADTQTSGPGPSRPVSFECTANLAVSEKRLRFAEESPPTAVAASAWNQGVPRSRTSGFLDSASLSSATWSNDTTTITCLPVSNFSPSLHFTPSEYNSSTPPSRASPKTPPSEENVTSIKPMDGSGLTALPAAGIVQAEVQFEPYGEGKPSYGALDVHRKGAGEALASA